VGVALLPARPLPGAALLVLAGGLALAGRHGRCRKGADCPEAA